VSEHRRFVHYVSVAAGVLIAGLCGLCTFNLVSGPEGAILFPFAVVIGGAPTLFGLWLIVHSLRRLSGRNGA